MLFLATTEFGRDEGAGPTTEALAFPTIGTLLVTGAAASMCCRTPSRPFTSWWSLLAYAAALLLLAGTAHLAAVWAVCKVYEAQLRAPMKRVIRGTWLCAALLPVTVLLAKGGSAWATPVLPVIAVVAVMFVRRGAPGSGRSAQSPAPDGIAPGLFRFAEPKPLLRTLALTVLVAVGMELGVVMLLSWQFALAGLLFGMCVAAAVWWTPLRVGVRVRVPGRWRAFRDTGLALLLTVLALLPSLSGSGAGAAMARLLGTTGVPVLRRAPPPEIHAAGGAAGGALSGVILTLPPKPKQKILPPPPVGAVVATGAKRTPTVILFDGAYWYFRRPDTAPRPGAKTVRGDPTKVEIRSTDTAALQMEAHQPLTEAMGTDCCREIEVTVLNAEKRPGAIGLEVMLGGQSGKGVWRESLGTLVIPSSVALGGGSGAEEVLRFAMPAVGTPRSFNELTVAVRASGERARTGAHVAVEKFELVPAP